jgi:DNA processing protein
VAVSGAKPDHRRALRGHRDRGGLERSGALITADFALEAGREVFAVPGEITSALSGGTNDLLRLGAAPLTCAADVLELFDLAPAVASTPALSEPATRILDALRAGSASADELARATGVEVGAVTAALVELELVGLAEEGEGRFRASA